MCDSFREITSKNKPQGLYFSKGFLGEYYRSLFCIIFEFRELTFGDAYIRRGVFLEFCGMQKKKKKKKKNWRNKLKLSFVSSSS